MQEDICLFNERDKEFRHYQCRELYELFPLGIQGASIMETSDLSVGQQGSDGLITCVSDLASQRLTLFKLGLI